MAIVHLFLLATFVRSLFAAAADPDSAPLRLRQTSAGSQWNDCFLIGNGRLGASILGPARNETIWLNEDTFWNGKYKSRINPKALSTLPTIRSAIVGGNFSAAQSLATSDYDGVPSSARNYNSLGQMSIVMGHGSRVQGYERWLDVDESTSGVQYSVDGVSYTREYIASHPTDVIAIRVASSQAGSVSFSAAIRRGDNRSKASAADTIVMTGDSGGDLPIKYAAGIRVVAASGNVSVSGSQIECTGADEAWIYFTAWTDVRQANPSARVLSDLKGVTRTYQDLREEHRKDYQALFRRAEFSFGASSAAQRSMSTAQRIDAMSKTYDPELAVLFLQFARYLLISSSRRGTLPANLQGIWNPDGKPMWGSRFTININLQMNYWPAFVTNLIDDVYEPFFDLVKKVDANGQNTARQMFNAQGSCAHHNTDLWGDTAPQDNWQPATTWTQGLAWLVMHTYDYYLYTGDVDFLRDNFGPIKNAARFYLDFLTPYREWMVTNPTTSPENTFIAPDGRSKYSVTLGSTIDNSLVRILFQIVLETHGVLGVANANFTAQIANLLAKLPPLRQNKNGGIMEWIEDYAEAEPGMSHVSQLIGAYPLADITSANQTTFGWAMASLNRRLSNGGGGIGWPRAWAMALAARFFRPQLVSDGVTFQLQRACRPTSMMNVGAPAQFQIDANLGSAAGMAEALLQSHEWLSADSTAASPRAAFYGEPGRVVLIRLLPSLPAAWAANGGGYAKGLRARGGFLVSVDWSSSGKLVVANVTSLAGNKAWLLVGSTQIGKNGPVIKLAGSGSGSLVQLSGPKGSQFHVTLDQES